MPTAYTALIEDGEVTTAKEYAQHAARAMMAFVHMRENRRDGRLTYPPKPKADDYHQKAYGRACADAVAWASTSEEEKYAQWSEYYEESLKSQAESKARWQVKDGRYNKVLDEVKAIEVPEIVQSFKDFLTSQIEESNKYGPYTYTPMSFVEWCEHQESRIERDLEYYPQQIAQEWETYRERRRYAQAYADAFGLEIVEE